MQRSKSRNRKALSFLLVSTILFTAACDMNQTIEKEIEKNDTAEKSNLEDSPANNKELNESQKEKLKESDSQTAEDAVKHNEQEKAVEASKKVVKEKENFTDLNEFVTYIQNKYYEYHAKLITEDQFYKTIEKYFSSKIHDNLPKNEVLKKQTFMTVQQSIQKTIKSPIKDYKYTTPNYNEKYEYAYSLRKYTLKNGKTIYFKLEMQKENNSWKVLDDRYTQPYIKIDEQYEFKERAKID